MTTPFGNLFIVSAPSGAGKSSLIRALLRSRQKTASTSHNPIVLSVSHTTRDPRPGETDGVDYHFVSKQQFETLIDQQTFFEWARVFDHFYGTSRVTVEQQLQVGNDVFLDIDWQGARRVKVQIPQAIGIFIVPPSLETLRQRLEKRQQDSEAVIATRMQQAIAEISHYQEFDYVIVNDQFEVALQQLDAIVTSQNLNLRSQSQRHTTLFENLMN
jgi:guanylate kinase